MAGYISALRSWISFFFFFYFCALFQLLVCSIPGTSLSTSCFVFFSFSFLFIWLCVVLLCFPSNRFTTGLHRTSHYAFSTALVQVVWPFWVKQQVLDTLLRRPVVRRLLLSIYRTHTHIKWLCNCVAPSIDLLPGSCWKKKTKKLRPLVFSWTAHSKTMGQHQIHLYNTTERPTPRPYMELFQLVLFEGKGGVPNDVSNIFLKNRK